MDSELKSVLDKSRDDLDIFTTLTTNIFIKERPHTITAPQYFSLGTKTIENLLIIFKLQNRAIKESSKGWF